MSFLSVEISVFPITAAPIKAPDRQPYPLTNTPAGCCREGFALTSGIDRTINKPCTVVAQGWPGCLDHHHALKYTAISNIGRI